jgi:hypothetical protein
MVVGQVVEIDITTVGQGPERLFGDAVIWCARFHRQDRPDDNWPKGTSAARRGAESLIFGTFGTTRAYQRFLLFPSIFLLFLLNRSSDEGMQPRARSSRDQSMPPSKSVDDERENVMILRFNRGFVGEEKRVRLIENWTKGQI